MSLIEFDFHLEPLFGLIIFAGLAAAAFVLWMLVDAILRPDSDFPSGSKSGWVIALAVGLLFSLVGLAIAVAYQVIVRRPAKQGARYSYAGGVSAPGVPSPAGSAPGVPRETRTVQVPPQQLVNCRTCGAKLVAGARFCHSCGASTQPEGS